MSLSQSQILPDPDLVWLDAHLRQRRSILDAMLSQLGLELVEGEPWMQGLNRLIAAGGTEQQIKTLKSLKRWVGGSLIVIPFSRNAAS
jgi:hypothetical protein